VWDDSDLDWTDYDLVVVRSWWDYVPRRSQFLEWARRVPQLVLAAVPGGRDTLLYARVDLVPGEDGNPVLMELELTEPQLYLGYDPDAADRMAAAISDRVRVERSARVSRVAKQREYGTAMLVARSRFDVLERKSLRVFNAEACRGSTAL